jgi:hypothetical protein
MAGLGAVGVFNSLVCCYMYIGITPILHHINAQGHVTIHMEGIKLACKTDSFAIC